MLYIREAGVLRIIWQENCSYSLVSVFDIAGRKLMSTPVPAANITGSFDINLNNLIPGMYIVKLETLNNDAFTLKFIR